MGHRFEFIFGSLLVGTALAILLSVGQADTEAAYNFQSLDQVAVIPNQELLLPVGNQVKQLKTAPITVPFKHDNRAIMLDTKVDHAQNATFILDTGATYTSISKELALSLGYDLDAAPKVNITTANGRVTIPKVTLKTLTLNGYTVHNVEATVMSMPAKVPFKGLLGLNFIKRQRLTIDLASDQLVLHPAS